MGVDTGKVVILTLWNDMLNARTIAVTTPGTVLSVDQTHFTLRTKGKKIGRIPPTMVDNIIIGNAVEVTRKALIRLAKTGVSVTFMDNCGRASCRLAAPLRNTPGMRINQYRHWVDINARLELASKLARAKITNSCNLLKSYRKNYAVEMIKRSISEIEAILEKMKVAETSAELMGYEGSAARSYWNAFGTLLRPEFVQWNGRNRRPPLDPANAALSYGYGILLNRTLSLIEASGLDPWIGFLHESSGRHPSLALDLMEPLRPAVVDRLILKMLNREQLRQEHFYRPQANGRTVHLTREGRIILLELMEDLMRQYEPDVFGNTASPLHSLIETIDLFRTCARKDSLGEFMPKETHATPI